MHISDILIFFFYSVLTFRFECEPLAAAEYDKFSFIWKFLCIFYLKKYFSSPLHILSKCSEVFITVLGNFSQVENPQNSFYRTGSCIALYKPNIWLYVTRTHTHICIRDKCIVWQPLTPVSFTCQETQGLPAHHVYFPPYFPVPCIPPLNKAVSCMNRNL